MLTDILLKSFQKEGLNAFLVHADQHETYEPPKGTPVPLSYKAPNNPFMGIKEAYSLWAKNHGPNRYARLFDKLTTERPSYRIRIPISTVTRQETNTENDQPFSAYEAEVIDILHGTEYTELDYSAMTVKDKHGRVTSLLKALQALNMNGRSAALQKLQENDRKTLLAQLTYNTGVHEDPEDIRTPMRQGKRFEEFNEEKTERPLSAKEEGQLKNLVRAIETVSEPQRPSFAPEKWPSEATLLIQKAYTDVKNAVAKNKKTDLAKLKKQLETYMAAGVTHDRRVTVFDKKASYDAQKEIENLRKKIESLPTRIPDVDAREKELDKLRAQIAKQESKATVRDVKDLDDLLKITTLDKLIDSIVSDPAHNSYQSKKSEEHEEYDLVVSRYPTDIMHMSTNRHWDSDSCMRLTWSRAGVTSQGPYVYKAIAFGGLVVYGTRRGDYNIDEPVCRTLLFPFQNVMDPDDIILLPINRVYRGANGVIPPNFLRTLYKLLDAFNDGNKGGKYSVFQKGFYIGDLVNPSGVSMPAIHVDTDSNTAQKTALLDLGITKYTIRPDGKIDVHESVTLRDDSGIKDGVITLPFGTIDGDLNISDATMTGGRGQNRSMESDRFTEYSPAQSRKESGYYIWRQRYANSPTAVGVGKAVGLYSAAVFPDHIKGDLHIRGNALRNLSGMESTTVDGSVILEGMPNLQNLAGFPRHVGRDVAIIAMPKLQSMRGLGGVSVPGNITIMHTNIRFLDAQPNVGKSWNLAGNFIRTTVGIPEVIHGDLVLLNSKQLRDLKDFPARIEKDCWISGCSLKNLHGTENTTILGNFFCNHIGLESLEYFPVYVGGDTQCAHNRLPGSTPIPEGAKGHFIMGDGFDESEEEKYEGARNNFQGKRDLADARSYAQFHPDYIDYDPEFDETTESEREDTIKKDKEERDAQLAGESSMNYRNGDIHMGYYKKPDQGMGVN